MSMTVWKLSRLNKKKIIIMIIIILKPHTIFWIFRPKSWFYYWTNLNIDIVDHQVQVSTSTIYLSVYNCQFKSLHFPSWLGL